MPVRLMLCVTLATALPLLAMPTPAIAAPAKADAARIRVVIDARALGEAAAFFEDEVGSSLRTAIEQAGYTLDDTVRADATVRMRISFFNEEDLDYQVQVDISAGEQVVQLEPLGCPQCTDEDLLETIGKQQSEILTGLERALVQTSEEPAPAHEDDHPEAPTTTKPMPIGALGGVGIGAAVLGVGMLVAGGVELGRGRVYDDRTRVPTERSFVDHRPLGGALLGAGGAVLAAGVTMLVVDLVRSKKRQRQQQTRLAFPLLTPDLIGLGYSGRF